MEKEDWWSRKTLKEKVVHVSHEKARTERQRKILGTRIIDFRSF